MLTIESRTRRLVPVQVLAVCLWLALVAWLVVEHRRVVETERTALLQRGRDISDTIALLSRTGRMGLIREDRLNSVLQELVQWELLDTIVLLNARGDVVASAGRIDLYRPENLELGAVRWDRDHAFVMNLVDLGHDAVGPDVPPRGPTIVIPAPDQNGGSVPRPDWVPNRMPPGPQLPPTVNAEDALSSPTQRGNRAGRAWWARESSGRPPWMSEAEFRDLVERRGFHSFVLILNTSKMYADLAADRTLRILVAFVSLAGLIGFLVAISQWTRSTGLLMRLLQSQQQNEHLKELNLAAAGLAHETRNPLNVIRGLAQTIDHDPITTAENRQRVRQIMEEIDMVTFRLNEFIRYSRPAQAHPTILRPDAVARSVQTALQADIEDRDLRITVHPSEMVAEADEMLLRQSLFNLVLNAIQAVKDPGLIEVRVVEGAGGSLTIVVDDNGPGVAADLRQEIFRPYFTTSDRGSGLGLAVVRQICAAHGWEIRCEASPLGGARFSLSGLKPSIQGKPP
jgi:signal transduction histidine kinase